MKKYILKGLLSAVVGLSLTSCGESFLETDYYSGVDQTSKLTEQSINGLVIGTYSLFNNYRFAGNYAVTIGDVATDISYWNTQTNHWNNLYMFTYLDTELYLDEVWEYGYKVVDMSSKVIKGADELLADADSNKESLNKSKAQALALRAYSYTTLVNVFAHQIKVNGQDFSGTPGIVISETPIAPYQEVKRATVGETYNFIMNDLKRSIACFEASGELSNDKCYITLPAVYGLAARVSLYMENWADAKQYAEKAIELSGIKALACTPEDYKALYADTQTNSESLFYLDINPSQNWSANSAGNVWSTYNFSPNPKLLSMYADGDARKSIMAWTSKSTQTNPQYAGGKYGLKNPSNQTNYLINAPEMFLIMAEANVKMGDIATATEKLNVVAKRNPNVVLPTDAAGLMQFIKDERARELVQEGLRLWDLRRWGDNVSVFAYGAPEIKFQVNNYNISNLVYPIPAAEINAGFGVTQNEGWNNLKPKM